MVKRIEYLESLLPVDVAILREKYRHLFSVQASYMGNGVYQWCGQYSTDTRELWLMGILIWENIEFKQV